MSTRNQKKKAARARRRAIATQPAVQSATQPEVTKRVDLGAFRMRRRITNDSEEDRKILLEMGLNPNDYTDARSFLFLLENTETLRGEYSSCMIRSGKIVWCVIEMVVRIDVDDDVNEFGCLIDEYDGIDFYNNFEPAFFNYLPRDVTTTECHGRKCRNDFNVADTGIWCESCHWELDIDLALDPSCGIIRGFVEHAEIPPENILHIRKTYQDVNFESDTGRIEKFLDYMEESNNTLQKSVDSAEDRVKAISDGLEDRIQQTIERMRKDAISNIDLIRKRAAQDAQELKLIKEICPLTDIRAELVKFQEAKRLAEENASRVAQEKAALDAQIILLMNKRDALGKQ